MQSTEEWRAVVGWEGYYEVSSLGRVRRHPTNRGWSISPGKILAQFTMKHGHKMVSLTRNSVTRGHLVHRLVAEAFHGPATGPVVRHLDGNPANNVPSNLAYGTQADNAQDAIRHGTIRYGIHPKTHCAHGHEFSPDNIRASKLGWWSCKTCHRERERVRRAERREGIR